MMKFFTYLNRLGIHDGLSRRDKSRILILNRYNTLAFVVAVLLLVHCVSYQLWVPAIGNGISIFLIVTPVFYFQWKRRYEFARLYFVLSVLLNMSVISYLNISSGRITYTDVLIVGFSSAIPTLFSGNTRRILFISFVVIMCLLQFHRFLVLDYPLHPELFNTVINYSVAFFSIYFFTHYFRLEVDAYADEMDNLNLELAKSKAELSQAKCTLDTMIDNTPLFLAMLDKKGNYLMVNEKYVEGFRLPKSKLIGAHYSEILPKKLLENHKPLIKRCLTGESIEFYEEIVLPNGDQTCSLGKYIPIKSPQGTVEYFTVFVADITQQKTAEKDLQQLNQTKDKLFSIIAHDLSGPIHLLRDSLYILSDKSISPEDSEELILGFRESVVTISHMLENLLLWSKHQFKGLPSTIEQSKIAGIVEEQRLLYKELLERKNIILDNKLPFDLEIEIQENDLRVILRNLINNAIKFTPQGGSIIIDMAENDSTIELSIQDTGFGIPQEKLLEIRNRAIVASSHGTAGESGTGLGLNLCSELSARNNWSINITSETNIGSTFTLVIPKLKILSESI